MAENSAVDKSRQYFLEINTCSSHQRGGCGLASRTLLHKYANRVIVQLIAIRSSFKVNAFNTMAYIV